MMLNPRIGQRVLIRYGRRYAASMPLHDEIGIVILRSSGKPRNHLIAVDGTNYVIPCGNLFPDQEE